MLYIFKTNIESQNQLKTLHQIFTAHQSIKDWWVDTEDIDRVMRVEIINNFIEDDVIALLQKSGFNCEILTS